jgi:hypothetical protein
MGKDRLDFESVGQEGSDASASDVMVSKHDCFHGFLLDNFLMVTAFELKRHSYVADFNSSR